ncbi:DUF2288 domain-containing protein [Dasania sp. GY-MA-18]|uniref:DUF2288 domain-containing protein n=1 Tax=Dasania phycosphaerae TaxID=2950436 RepID=A0A9J6RMM1_9GAMM|nr:MULTISPECIES: DUF2288 domain-containing protein [Dasania]MCR8923339.1 DUF2288 domain-containing protein [Dasania sp. GY-MA-18]MCZ0865771.1 DUF2288 domain-containing protein [Dasania phycosphaerae]MCZ0869496.1 DUF2288 domain-containing protein [Dasania phycosphaerae]
MSESTANPIPETAPEEDLRTKLNRETSKISWHELQKFYAKGAVIGVAAGMDLIEVGVQISADNKTLVQQWLADGSISQVNDQQAQAWYEQEQMLWAVVIMPWVLVQPVVEASE